MSATKCKPISMLPPLPCIILIQASNRGKDKVQTATSGSRRPLWQAASGRSKSRIDQLHRKPTCNGAGVSMDPFARLDCHFIAWVVISLESQRKGKGMGLRGQQHVGPRAGEEGNGNLEDGGQSRKDQGFAQSVGPFSLQIHRYCGQWGRSQTTSACCRWRRRIPWAGCFVVRIARREFAWAP